MAKEMMSARIDADLMDALRAEAVSDRRTVSNMLEWVLRERYSRALTERRVGSPSTQGVDRAAGAGPLAEGKSSVTSQPPRSVSADVAATIPGVKLASSVCGVAPPGRSRPACSLDARHDGKHSWEA